MKIEKFLEVSPVFAVGQSFQSFSRFIQNDLKREKVNLLQGLILVSLLFEKKEKIRPGMLAEVFKTSKSSVGQAISALEEKGLIKRGPLGEDARTYNLVISPSGTDCANRIMRVLAGLQTKFEKTLGEDRIKNLIEELALLQKITQEILE